MRRRGKTILIIVFLIVAALLAAASYFLYSFYVPDEQAEVQGNIRYTDAEIRRMAMPGFKEHNSLYLRFLHNEISLPDVPFIESIEVEYLGPDRVRLQANEEFPVGYLLQEGYRYYFSASGIVTEKLEDEVQKKEEEAQKREAEKQSVNGSEEETGGASSDTAFRPALTGVSLVSGLTENTYAVGEQIMVDDMDIFHTLQTVGKLANKLDIHPDEILVGENGTLTLRYEEVLVSVGTKRMLEEKMSRAAAILPQLEGMEGTLHLENYSSGTINIIFSTAQEEEQETENYSEENEYSGEAYYEENGYSEEIYYDENEYYGETY